MSDRDWLVPAVLLTLFLLGAGLFLIPDPASALGAASLLPLWILASAALGGIFALPALQRMKRQGVRYPSLEIIRMAARNWRAILFVAFAMLLAGINMVTFMWCKPLLNHLVPFRVDPLLAEIDYRLFLGNDPSRLLGWMNSMATAIFYHRAWFAMMVMTLLMVLTRPPSPQKSALLVSYFALWSLVGPVIHLLFPAAGPVFYHQLGYGDRFEFIHVPAEMAQMSDYLWHAYSAGSFLPGAGISAMPSLHIATTMWMVIAVFVLARSWTAPVAAIGLVIFLLSIALGWHYAIDGIVGAAAALGCYAAALRFYRWKQSRAPEGATPALVAAE
jgi:hypothetical protein